MAVAGCNGTPSSGPIFRRPLLPALHRPRPRCRHRRLAGRRRRPRRATQPVPRHPPASKYNQPGFATVDERCPCPNIHRELKSLSQTPTQFVWVWQFCRKRRSQGSLRIGGIQTNPATVPVLTILYFTIGLRAPDGKPSVLLREHPRHCLSRRCERTLAVREEAPSSARRCRRRRWHTVARPTFSIQTSIVRQLSVSVRRVRVSREVVP